LKCLMKDMKDNKKDGRGRLSKIVASINHYCTPLGGLHVNTKNLTITTSHGYLPTAVLNFTLNYAKHAISMACAQVVLQKARAFRGADRHEYSAWSRMSYCGLLLHVDIAEALYLTSNLARFCADVSRVYFVGPQKDVNRMVQALAIIFDDQSVDLCCDMPVDLCRKCTKRKDAETGVVRWQFTGTKVSIINVYGVRGFLSDDKALPTDLVVDFARIGTNWESADRSHDWEKINAAHHLARLKEWSSWHRRVVGRIVLHERLATCQDAKNPASQYIEAIRKNVGVASIWTVLSGVEIHNLVGWEYVGPTPVNLIDKSKVWWYNEREMDQCLTASVVANVARVQYPYTMLDPCSRLRANKLRAPYVPLKCMSKIVKPPVFAYMDAERLETLRGMSQEEIQDALVLMQPGEQAYAIRHLLKNQDHDHERDSVEGEDDDSDQGPEDIDSSIGQAEDIFETLKSNMS